VSQKVKREKRRKYPVTKNMAPSFSSLAHHSTGKYSISFKDGR
jgi:hypothetical protein